MLADTGVIFYLTGLAIAVTILHSFLKQAGRDEYAYMTLVVGLALGLLKIIPVIKTLFDQVQSVFNLY